MQSVIDAKRKAIVATVDDRIRLQKELVTKTDELMNAVNERQRLEKLGASSNERQEANKPSGGYSD